LTYKVIKKIKGHYYIYEQESYRQDGKVRTRNRYLGLLHKEVALPIDDVHGKIYETLTVPKETPKDKKINGNKNKDVAERAIINNRTDLNRYRISETAIKKIAEKFIVHLESMGIDTQTMSKIKLRYGTKVGYKKAFSGAYVVYLPKYASGNRTKFQKAIGRALIMSGLELIRKQKPELYDYIKQRFDESYRKTQWMLWNYILNTNDYKKLFKALGLIVFRIYTPIYKSRLPAEDLGLTDFKRKTWQDEIGDLITQVMRKGYKGTLRFWNEKFFKARANEKKATKIYIEQKEKMGIIKKMGGWMKKWRHEMKRAIAKRQAHEEIYRRLVVIKEVFKF